MENLLPPLDDFDLKQLRASIRENGILEPIVIDEAGNVIDGFNRQRIAAEFGADCPARTVTGLTELEKQDLAILLNVHRRHLTPDEKRTILRDRRLKIEAALIAEPTRSNMAIAEELGTTHPTVAAVRERLESDRKLSVAPYQAGGVGGGGARVVRDPDADPPAENHADHRGSLYFEFTLHYPWKSDITRSRGEDPYRQESDRLDWPTGTLWLTADKPPTTHGEFAALLAEAMKAIQKVAVERPLKSMPHRESIYAELGQPRQSATLCQ